jgi:hypothetical protein
MNHQRRDSPRPGRIGRSHGRPNLVDLIQQPGNMDPFYTAAGSMLWDGSCSTQDLRNLDNIRSHDDGRMQQKQQNSSVAGCPRLLPSPHIQRANAVDHNGCVAVCERVNEDASGWLSSDSSISTDNKYEENEAMVALEPPCRPLATQMSTPPPPPVSTLRTPSESRPVKIPSTPCHNKSEDNNSPIHPNSHGAREC